MNLTRTDKEKLLVLARNTIGNWLDPPPKGSVIVHEIPSGGALSSCCGAFVTLHVDGRLRGCIGTFSEEQTLWENVRHMALSAATSDDRFSPIESSELDRLHIEISVLSPREKVENIREIIPGVHGIYMVRGANRGTLLPRVAAEQNWTLEELLGNCARYKAGIGWDGWRTAELYTYTATVFHSEPGKAKR